MCAVTGITCSMQSESLCSLFQVGLYGHVISKKDFVSGFNYMTENFTGEGTKEIHPRNIPVLTQMQPQEQVSYSGK